MFLKYKHVSIHQWFQNTLRVDNKIYFKIQVRIGIFVSSSKIQLLEKQQFVIYTQDKTSELYFLYFTSSLKKCGLFALFSSQCNCLYFYALMIENTKICHRKISIICLKNCQLGGCLTVFYEHFKLVDLLYLSFYLKFPDGDAWFRTLSLIKVTVYFLKKQYLLALHRKVLSRLYIIFQIVCYMPLH